MDIFLQGRPRTSGCPEVQDIEFSLYFKTKYFDPKFCQSFQDMNDINFAERYLKKSWFKNGKNCQLKLAKP